MTVDRILRQPPVHIDGKGLRAYWPLEQMAAKVSKEPKSTECCVVRQWSVLEVRISGTNWSIRALTALCRPGGVATVAFFEALT